MNLRQLQYITALARHRLNVTAAADSLHTSQPGVSKQIRLLEDELGLELFERHGKHLRRVTPAGLAILKAAFRVLNEADNLKGIAVDLRDPQLGELTIATTHTQARYVLPPVVACFRDRYPKVVLHLREGAPSQLADWCANGEVDMVIATEAFEYFDDAVMMPCHTWNRAVIAPADHPVMQAGDLTLERIARYPILTYGFAFTGRSQLDAAFRERALHPNVVFTATDTDVLKTYVRAGLGIAIIARVAYAPEHDHDLAMLDAGHLFEPSQTRIALRRGAYIKSFMYDFIELYAPHLPRHVVAAATSVPTRDHLNILFADVELPEL